MRPRKVVLPLLLFASPSVCWEHIGESGLREALQSNDYTLAACKCRFNHQPPRALNGDTSKDLEEEWAAIQKSEGARAVSFDCAEQPKFCQEHDVVSHPTIRLYRGKSEGESEKIDRYRGPRKASSYVMTPYLGLPLLPWSTLADNKDLRASRITSFIRRGLRPVLSTVDRHNVTWFMSTDDVVFVAQLQARDSNAHDRFLALAQKYHDRYSFAVNTEARPEKSEITCQNTPDGLQKKLPDLSAVGALENFVKMCSTPLIPELTRRNELQYLTARKSLVRYFVSSERQRDEYVRTIRPLAKKYHEFLNFATVDVNEYPDAVAMFGHEPRSSGVLTVQNPTNGGVFPYYGGEEISVPVVESFLSDVVSGKVQAWTGERPLDDSDDSDETKHEEL